MVYNPHMLNVLSMGLYDAERAQRCFTTQVSKPSVIMFPYPRSLYVHVKEQSIWTRAL